MKIQKKECSTYSDIFLCTINSISKTEFSKHNTTFEDLKKMVKVDNDFKKKIMEISKIQFE